MLETLRKQKRGIFGLVIIAFCGALMLPFGLDMFRSGGAQDSAIQVNDTKLDSRQFYGRLQQIQESFRAQLGENFPAFRKMLNLEQRTADDLVNGILVDSYIEKLGLGANLTQIEEKIASHPFFKDSGITKSTFETFLRVQGLNSDGLEAMTKRGILIEQIDKLFADFSVPSKKEQESLKRIDSRTAKFKYFEFNPENFKAQVKLENIEKLEAYFKEHSNDYLTKKAVAFSAVAFTPQEFVPQVEVDQSEITEIYEYDQHEYFNPAQVKIKQYVVNKDRFITNSEDAKKSPQDIAAATAVAKEYINKVDAKLKAGEEFDKAVGTDSDQPIDVGWIDDKALEAEVRPVAKALKVGEVSGVIETPQYYKIIKLEDKKDKSKKTFDEVKTIIEAKLKNDNAPEYARAAAESFLNKARSGNITEVAQKDGKQLITTPQAISQGEIAPGTTPNAIKQILSLQEGDLEIVNDGDTSYVVSVTKIIAPEIPPFDKVEAQIKEAVINKEASELAKKAAQQASDSIAAGISFEEAAKVNSAEIKKSEFLSKNAAGAAPFSIDSNKTAAMGLTVKNPIYKEVLTEAGSYYIVGLEEEKFEEPAQKDKNEINEEQQGANRLFEALVKYLKSKAEVKIDPALLESNS